MHKAHAFLVVVIALAIVGQRGDSGEKKDGGVVVDKEKRVIKIDAKIAPRKLEHLKGEIYPIEVIACWAHPKGKKAHETVVTVEAKPSAVHKALESLGVKAGKPVMGESKDPPVGPDVVLYLEIATPDGVKKVTMDKALIEPRLKKPFPKDVKFRFTGSVMSKPDPNKDEMVYGADLTGTLIAIFPVTDQTVLQTNLTMKYERLLKLEVNTNVLPPEGTAVKLCIEVPAK